VYVVLYDSAPCGVIVAVCVAVSYVTVAGTRLFTPSRSVIDDVVTLVGSIGSLKDTVCVLPTETPVVPFAGVLLVTVGGVTSGVSGCTISL
jgi:hypothetical protein